MNLAEVAVIEQKKVPVNWVGKPVPRREDQRFLMGKGTYVPNLRAEGQAYVVFLRSPFARAKIKSIDAEAAKQAPGIVNVFTGKDIIEHINPLPNLLAPPYGNIKDYGIAEDEARYMGEPVAAIVAENVYQAWDAADLVEVEYEPLDAVSTIKGALDEKGPKVHSNIPSNSVWNKKFKYGDTEKAFKDAHVVVKKKLKWHRFTSAPLEPNAAIVDYDETSGIYTFTTNNQRPVFNQQPIATALGVNTNRLHFISPDIGGGFGIKNDSHPYMIVLAALSKLVGRPVKWVETRTEHMQASEHGNEIEYEGEMAFSKDGQILGMRAVALHDEGAYMRREPVGAFNFIRHATMTYTFENLDFEINALVTNKCPVGPNRSYGKMQQGFLVERLIDLGAKKLGMDRIAIRYKNFVKESQMPYQTPTGAILDGGDYEKILSKISEAFDMKKLVQRRDEIRKSGKFAGIGIAMGMDACPINFSSNRIINPNSKASGESEAAWVRIDQDGGISAAVGTSPQGHGHETSVAQIVSDVLGVTPDEVYSIPGFDSWNHPWTVHSGTYASRFAIAGAAAVQGAAIRVRDKILRIASHVLKEPVDNLSIENGKIMSEETPDTKLTLKDIAFMASRDLASLPKNEEPGLFVNYVYKTPFDIPTSDQTGNFSLTYSYSASIVLISVDKETGVTKVERVGIYEDCGNQINPLIVEGQVHGQLGHQLGAALYENIIYDEQGQLLTSTFKDYLAPTAADLPNYETGSINTPSLFTPMGTRGTGEGGGAPIIACVNAMDDALSSMDVEFTSSFLDPVEIRKIIKEHEVDKEVS